eukprot:CAMPEP_0118932584 /NCGR_PEP_ID=MMETSP1169-20130426/10509_1 /TAXON_ID=36882 /ORGANISM="Pyramimonas obovata, Strain CCMP722" /LENGTH=77 /DNA_ID=CAMNT_0006875265 /DNA_START=93 /DNA_END=326 /DNA_ORIENTATION=-
MAVSDGPIGWLEPAIMFGVLAMMFSVLFGVVGKFRKEKMTVCRKELAHDSDFCNTEGEEGDDDDDNDEGDGDKEKTK